MSEFYENIKVEIPSEKNFGIVFSVVFLLLGFYPLVLGESVHLWAFGVAALLMIIVYSSPNMLSPINRLWFKLGVLLGVVIAPIVMMFVYLTTVVPIGIIMKSLGKDLLRRKLDKGVKSYWIIREQPISSMKDQF